MEVRIVAQFLILIAQCNQSHEYNLRSSHLIPGDPYTLMSTGRKARSHKEVGTVSLSIAWTKLQ